MLKIKFRTFSGAAVVAITAATLAMPAGAQVSAPADAPTAGGDDIVVTGSRIRRDPLDQDKPVLTVDQSAIGKTGLSSIADVLQRLPSASGGLNTKVNNAGNIGGPPDGTGVSSGAAEIDLRYLGAKRTLVLVDGIRYVNGSSAGGIPASVDLNEIPTNMIERVEVLQSGASPLYGSDAVAGVVNIITKQSQKGLQANAQFGTYRQGDGHTQNYELSYGIQKPDSGTSAVFGGYYTKQDPVRTADRAISQYPAPYATSCVDPNFPDGVGCSGTPPLGRYRVSAAVGNLIGVGTNLTLKAPVTGRNPTAADFTTFTDASRFNFSPFNYLLTPNERYGAFFNFKQELSDAVHFRTKLVYNKRNSTTQAAFLPLAIGPGAGNGNLLDRISIDATNPYNPFGVTLSSGVNQDGTPSALPANYTGINRRFVEGGQRTFSQDVNTFTASATLDGSFHVGEHKWYWDVNGVWGLNDAHQIFTGNLNAARLAQALGPVANCTGDCVPFNIFGGAAVGGPGTITPAMLKYVTFDEHDKSEQRLADFTANLSGDLFQLPAGAVGVAIGYEHRDQRASYDPDPVIVAGLGADVPTSPARGSYNTDEVYGEIRVPILANMPFFHRLEFDGAVRHSDYSTFGGNTVFTASGLWKPVPDLLFRGGYAESLRAPSLGELYAGRSRFDATINDPCTSASGGSFQSNATVRANCIANGVPANGSYAESQGGQIGIFSQGSTALKPETATTWTAGGVYSPSWARGSFASSVSLEVNYYSIELKNAVDSVPGTLTLNRCAFNGDPVSCANITRTVSGEVAGINGTLQNLNAINTSGLDATFLYRSPAVYGGTIGLSANAAYIIKYDVAPPAELNAPTLRCVGTERCLNTDQAFPEFKLNSTLDWSSAAFGASFTARYISAVYESDGHRMGATFYGDVQVYFSPAWLSSKLRLTAGVNNVFNKAPPSCNTCDSANFDPTTYDLPGQFGYLRLSYGL
ncbi:TonB-dependent receptor domain-containing protein [Sphingomonas sp. BAUL-RG-20F-R05-02]|uniref:TonB-dependent receptor domain-containing protein n=1 Tax=Sphingomonas sp. BAUL-RG-20F-R05-02 TaxID=2914830 RepID=UPI001F57072C|nr:TonB-dependent receptor [Sphingomonas sp. BAUL-RG-20F-R05-02]